MRAELTRAEGRMGGRTDRPDEANRHFSRLTRTRLKISTGQKIYERRNNEAPSGLNIPVSCQLVMLFNTMRSQFCCCCCCCSQLHACYEYYYYHYGLLLRFPEALYVYVNGDLSVLNLSAICNVKISSVERHCSHCLCRQYLAHKFRNFHNLPTFQTGYSHIIIIIIIRSLSYDRTAAFSIACSPQTAICCFLFQFPCPFVSLRLSST